NGTIVGGTRVDRCQLHGSDEIRIGSTRIIFFPGRPALLSPRPALDGAALGKLYEDEGEETGDLTRTDGTGNALLPGRLPSRLKATIEVVEGPDAGLRLEVPKGALVIGREHADLRLRDPNVSRKHALLEILASDQIYLKDLASKNGTIVNGILVKVARLRSGDSIELGDTRLLFQAEVFV
ncbi:MAG: FHA domain-containing protein, partial [Bdellovibrionota bacterium]